ncbi:hypothetical protein T03_11574, partial [Trichinella britovi]
MQAFCLLLIVGNKHLPNIEKMAYESRYEQPDRHMHLTYPWPPVALVTAVLRGISVSGTSSIDSIFSDITCKSA